MKFFNFSKIKNCILLIILFCLTAISLLYTENISRGVLYLQKYLVFLTIPFIFSVIKFNKKTLKLALGVFTLVVFFLLIYCEFISINSLIKNKDPLKYLFEKKYSYLNFSNPVDIHPAYFSFFIITSILVVYDILISNKTKKYKIIGLILVAFFSLTIIQLANRTYLLVLFIVLNWCFFNYLKNSFNNKLKNILTVIFVNSLLVLFVYNLSYTQKRIQQIFGYTYANGYKHEDGKNKLKQWKSTLSSNNNILIGNGIGDTNSDIIEKYKENKLAYFYKKKYNAHNQYLQIYVGLGLLGVIILILILLHGIYYKGNSGIYFILFVVFPIVFLTESYLERHHGIITFTLLYSINFIFSKKKFFL